MPSKPTAIYLIPTILAGLLIACAAPGRLAAAWEVIPPAPPRLRPGDTIGSMSLDTGAARAASIWVLCRPVIGSGSADTECTVPPVPRLAIGPNTVAMASVGNLAGWDHVNWELYLNGHAVDLDAFGTFNFARWMKGYRGREVATLQRAWDVVLVEPAPGRHTLRAVVRTEGLMGDEPESSAGGEYVWVINFTIQKGPTYAHYCSAYIRATDPGYLTYQWIAASGVLCFIGTCRGLMQITRARAG